MSHPTECRTCGSDQSVWPYFKCCDASRATYSQNPSEATRLAEASEVEVLRARVSELEAIVERYQYAGLDGPEPA